MKNTMKYIHILSILIIGCLVVGYFHAQRATERPARKIYVVPEMADKPSVKKKKLETVCTP